jgi:predicted branched-subunit amino acid permease
VAAGSTATGSSGRPPCSTRPGSAGTVLGVVFAPSPAVIETSGLDVIFPAFFLILLIDELRGSRSRTGVLSAVLGAVISGVLLLVVPVGVALLGATAAAAVGLPKTREADR